MKKENPGGFSFFIGAELRIRVKRGKVKRRHKKIFAGAVYHNAQTSCATLLSPRGPSLALRAIHLVLRLRRPSGLCSSTLSVNCEYFTKVTQW